MVRKSHFLQRRAACSSPPWRLTCGAGLFGLNLFCARWYGWIGFGACVDFTEWMALAAGVALAAEETLLAIQAFPGKETKDIHESMAEFLFSCSPPG
jgi:hypothetical protein